MPVTANVTVRDLGGHTNLSEFHTPQTSFDLTNALNAILVRAGYYTGGNVNVRVTVDVLPTQGAVPNLVAPDPLNIERMMLARGVPSLRGAHLLSYDGLLEALWIEKTSVAPGATQKTTDEMIRQLGEDNADKPHSENNG